MRKGTFKDNLISPFTEPRIQEEDFQRFHERKDSKKKRANDWKSTVARIWRYLSVKKASLWFVLLMVLLSSVFALLGPFVVGVSIDRYLVEGQSGLMYAVILLAVIYIFHSISVFLQHYIMIGVAQETVYTMRTGLFKHIHKLPIPFFDKRKHGELMSRLTNDIENVSNTLNSSVIQIFSSVLTLIGTLAVMLYLSPLLMLITLIIVPVMVYGMKWITKRTGRLFKAQQANLGELNGYIQESMSGQKMIKAFSQEERVRISFEDRNKDLRMSAFWAQTISGFIPKLMNMLNNVSFAIVAGLGGLFALNGMISIGVIVIFAEYARQFTRPLNDLANQFNTLLSAIAGAERVFQIIDEEDEILEDADKENLDSIKGRVRFEKVGFSYAYGEETLRNVSFSVRKGEVLALVGPTGAGKTTIVSLLTRFYNPTEGEIYIDEIPLSRVKKESVRQHMAFVLQDSFLFAGTIRENIRYGRLDASDEEVIRAAKDANAHSFISAFPDGYDTKIDASGGGISQGQKQLLSIARALLANPTILILDEATSNIDTITEIKIQEAFTRLMKGRTSIVIAHRLNTVRQADQILVLNEGEMIERGNHETLLEKNGFYADLYNSQLKEEVG